MKYTTIQKKKKKVVIYYTLISNAVFGQNDPFISKCIILWEKVSEIGWINLLDEDSVSSNGVKERCSW